MNRKLYLSVAAALLLGVSLIFLPRIIKNSNAADCDPDCPLTEIGQIDALGNFTTLATVDQDQSYWVRLTVLGKDTPRTPADIMLILDTTGSMNNDMRMYRDPANRTLIHKIDAGRRATNSFIDMADGDNSDGKVDRLGFAVWNLCNKNFDRVTESYDWWYGGTPPSSGSEFGYGILFKHLQDINGQKTSFKNAVNSVVYPDGTVKMCYVWSGPSTDTGAAFTIANSQFVDILGPHSPTNNLRKSYGGRPGYNDGPYARGGNIKKVMIHTTDGAENIFPKTSDLEVNGGPLTRLETTTYPDNNIRIYTIHLNEVDDSGDPDTTVAPYIDTLKQMSKETGGRYYFGNSFEELSDSYRNIYDDVTLSGKVSVSEHININYFQIDTPTSSNFRITRPASGGGEEEIHQYICKDTSPPDGTPDCISNISTASVVINGVLTPIVTSMDIQLDEFRSGDKRFIYFKVTPYRGSNGAAINITNSGDSTVNYSDAGSVINIYPGSVIINGSGPYFQVQDGDVYSHATGATSIKSEIPLSKYFAQSSSTMPRSGPMIFHRDIMRPTRFSPGTVSETRRELAQYSISERLDYATLYDKYKNKLENKNITNTSFARSGYYIQSPISSQKLILSSPGWGNLSASNEKTIDKKVVIFVDGDLYIKNNVNFKVEKDGISSLIFVVKGRLGIDSAVKKVEGIYIVDGIIDTACSTFTSAEGNNDCGPDTAADQLTLEGTFYTNSGFSLQRVGTPGSAPGEIFKYRPDMLFAATEFVGKELVSWKENSN